MHARILLIEDNPANLELMTYLLRVFGYVVLVAMDGGEGLTAVRREAPDLIVCDVQLPTMDGFEVARWLKSDAALRNIPLIAVTAYAMVGDRDRVLAAGFDGYIAKPIDPETFVRQVAAFLPANCQRPAPLSDDSIGLTLPATAVSRHHAILVVDDSQVNLDLARSILEPHGYEVVTAGGMAEALVAAKSRHFDLILSDVCMADCGNGFDFIRAVKADPALALIPFVFLTATRIDESGRALGLVMGATRYLMRPIDPAALLAELEICLRETSKT